MAYRIEGLKREQFEHLFGLSDEELAEHNARRITAATKPGYPCRVTLEDAEAGENILVVNFTSNDSGTPYRTAFAIFVREGAAKEAAAYVDRLPPVFDNRTLSLRGFDSEGALHAAVLAHPGEIEPKIHELFDMPEVAVIHAHNAAYGCFAAKIERS